MMILDMYTTYQTDVEYETNFTIPSFFFSVIYFQWRALVRETLARLFSSEFCEVSKNTFFKERLWATASGDMILLSDL